MNIYNSKRYVTFSWEDETSQFDPKGIWSPGCEYYFRTYKVRVPAKMYQRMVNTGEEKEIFDWIERNEDKEIWR